MNPLPNEQILILHECLLELSIMLRFSLEDVKKVFYCGVSQKWYIPNSLLVVIKDDDSNWYTKEMSDVKGCYGSGYLPNRIVGSPWTRINKPYHFVYSVIFERVYDKSYWFDLLPPHCLYPGNTYSLGLPVLDEMKRLEVLAAFI